MSFASRKDQNGIYKARWLKIAAQRQRMAETADPAGQQAQQPQSKEKPGPHNG
jgi:hypothetical protein